jgi:hypothetical protein
MAVQSLRTLVESSKFDGALLQSQRNAEPVPQSSVAGSVENVPPMVLQSLCACASR